MVFSQHCVLTNSLLFLLCLASSLLLKWEFELRHTMPPVIFFLITHILLKRSFGDKACPPTIVSLEEELGSEHAEEEEQGDKREEGKVSENSLPVDPSLPADIENVSLNDTIENAEVGENEEPSENGAAETIEEGNMDALQEPEDSRSPQGITFEMC